MVAQIRPITVTTTIKTFRKQEQERVPEHYCRTCGNRKDNHCDVFKRHVDIDYNRCFNHTNYPIRQISFKAPENLEEIMENESKRIC